MENKLKACKSKIIEEIGEEKFHLLKFSKLLKLIQPEIEELFNYWTMGQVLELINNEFNLKISKTTFYVYCKKNIHKKSERNIEMSEKIDDEKKVEESIEIKNIDDLTDSTLSFLSKNLPKK